MNFDIDTYPYIKILKSVCDFYKVKLYLVGGAVRDSILNRSISDFDFLVEEKIDDIAETFAQEINKNFILFNKEIKIFRFVLQNCTIDIAQLYPSTIETELQRRDFTIDSVAIDLDTKVLIDPLNGISDIENRIVKFSNPNIFKDDPVRLIRLFRIAAQLKFDIDKKTLEQAKNNLSLIKNISADRITQELEKFFIINDTFSYVLLIDRIGLLDELFEDFAYQNGCMQSESHLYDVKAHSLAVYNFVEWSILRMKRILGENCFVNYYGYYKLHRKELIIALKLAALFHDCSKPFVKQINNNTISFKNHEAYSAAIFKKYVKKYNFQKKIAQMTIFLILNHIEPAYLFLKWKNNNLTDDLLYDFFDKFQIHGVDLLIFGLSDTLAKGKIRMVNREVFIDFLKDMTCFYFERYLNFLRIPKILEANDLLKLGLKNADLGKSLKLIRKNTFLQNIKTKEEALAFARQFLSE
ncbi:MAG: hypothetical protein ACPLXO_01170 [Desulfurella sp.]|uniref:hypothetical protein n=1 Tax=Desulfurella sp. TaxID=1962857 RepID=UPI003CA1A8EB